MPCIRSLKLRHFGLLRSPAWCRLRYLLAELHASQSSPRWSSIPCGAFARQNRPAQRQSSGFDGSPFSTINDQASAWIESSHPAAVVRAFPSSIILCVTLNMMGRVYIIGAGESDAPALGPTSAVRAMWDSGGSGGFRRAIRMTPAAGLKEQWCMHACSSSICADMRHGQA